MSKQMSSRELAALWEIGQLPIRYALAIDSRNVDLMAGLFSDQSEAGKWGRGREGLHNFYKTNWKKFRRSIHTVSNHSIDLIDSATARGTVYCHAQQESPTTGNWSQLQMAYEDDYIREEGRWVFLLRKIYFWYRDVDGARQYGGGKNPSLPDLWPTWAAYWIEPAVERST